MTQEDKDLLIEDICSRLPYGVMVRETNGDNFDYRGLMEKGPAIGVTDYNNLYEERS